MTLLEYGELAAKLSIYKKTKFPFYAVLGICGEAGEIAEKVKKMVRDHGGRLTKSMTRKLLLELGDELWYVNALARDLGSSLEEIAAMNIRKLRSRKKRGTLRGSGDGR